MKSQRQYYYESSLRRAERNLSYYREAGLPDADGRVGGTLAKIARYRAVLDRPVLDGGAAPESRRGGGVSLTDLRALITASLSQQARREILTILEREQQAAKGKGAGGRAS